MKKFLIACCAILAVAAFASDASLAQRGHAMRGAGGVGHVGGGMSRGVGIAHAPRSVAPAGGAAFGGHRAYYGGQRIVNPRGAARYRGGLPIARGAQT